MDWRRSILSAREEEKIENKISEFETKTATELVVCVLKAADPYPGAIYRFAILFSLLFATAITFLFQFDHEFYLILLVGFLIILGTILGKMSFIKKLALVQDEIDREVREKSIELFQSLEINRTKDKIGILLLLSLQERKIEILVGKKLSEKISQEDLDNIVKHLSNNFKNNDFGVGFLWAIDNLSEKVTHFFPKLTDTIDDSKNELSNKIVWGDFSK